MTQLSPQLMRLWARWCAREVVHLWDAPEVVVDWLDKGSEELRRDAGGSAATASYEIDTASSAVDLGAYAAGAAAYAAHARVGSAVVYAAAADAAQKVSKGRRKAAKSLIRHLSASLTDLSSLRLDIAHSDPWLTREVWRALGLEDMQFVEDWYEWIETKTRNGGQKDQNERQGKMESIPSTEATAGKGIFLHPNT